MLRERFGAPFTSWMLPSLVAAVACSNATPSDPGPGGAPGVALDSWQAREGTVSIVGASPSVPVSNQSLSGYREGSSEFVRCTHDPAGLASYRPALTIEAGSSLPSRRQLSLTLFDILTPAPVGATYTASSQEGALADFALEVSLSPELDRGAYVYAAGVDENVDPPSASTCDLEITRFDVDELVGTLKCAGLLPVEDSSDRPLTNAPLPRADVSLAFDCPLLTLDDEAEGGSGGSNAGGGGTNSGTGGSDGTGGSLEPSCRGTATECSSLSGTSCVLSLGCSASGECSGSATSCYYLFNSYSCYAQSGCYWSNGDCQGFASSCSGQLSEYACGDQDGCTWSETCEGAAWACSDFTAASDCEAQSGCYWL